jgi:hypothetical protein
MTDEPLTICPECGGNIRRVLFPAGVVFKGSGFYKTDHNSSNSVAAENGNAKKNDKPGSGNEGETKSASESSSETSTARSSETKVPASTK